MISASGASSGHQEIAEKVVLFGWRHGQTIASWNFDQGEQLGNHQIRWRADSPPV